MASALRIERRRRNNLSTPSVGRLSLNLDPIIGKEIRKARPAVIIQNNKSRKVPTVIHPITNATPSGRRASRLVPATTNC